MIDTNKVLEQIYKLILAYTKDKKLDSNKAKYVLKTAVEKVLEFNNLNIEAAETIVSAIEKSKVLEKIKSLDFNRLSSNKDYVDPLYGKPINVKQVLSIVHGVIDSQIKSLDTVLFEAQDEEIKREINEIKSSPTARFSPNAYKLLSKRLVLLESEDPKKDKKESKPPEPYKKLLEIYNIIYKDNPLDEIKEIITEFKEPSVYDNKTIDFESKKKAFVSNILSKKRGKIVEAIFLNNLENSGLFNVEVEGGGTYFNNILPGLMKKGKSSFNLYSLYNEIINNESFELEEATIEDVKTFDDFDEYIEKIEEFKRYNKLCKRNITTFKNKINEYFTDISGKITFGAFKTKFKFSEEKIQDFYFIEDESVKEKINKNENIKNISVVNNCFIPKDITSSFDFYLDLKITLEDDSYVIIDKGLCVDVKNYTSSKNKSIGITGSAMTSLANFPFVAIVNIKTNNLQIKTFLTKSVNKENSTYFKDITVNLLNTQEDFDESFNNIDHFVEVADKTEDPAIKKELFEKVKSLKIELKSFSEITDILNNEFNISKSRSFYNTFWLDYAEDGDIAAYNKAREKSEERRRRNVIKLILQGISYSQIRKELSISPNTITKYWKSVTEKEKEDCLKELGLEVSEGERRRRNVIKYILQGKSYSQIQNELRISPNTITKYLNNATKKEKEDYLKEIKKAVIKLKLKLKKDEEIKEELDVSLNKISEYWNSATEDEKEECRKELEASESK